MIDALHHAAHVARGRTLQAARELLDKRRHRRRSALPERAGSGAGGAAGLETFTGIDEPAGLIAEAAGDFEALEMLRRLAFPDQVDEPAQLELWKEEAAVSLLTDREWKTKYTPEDGDLVALFYVPALDCAVRYERTTGYFSASALAVAARGIEGLIRNDGRMRLIVGCTLDAPEVAAIERGTAAGGDGRGGDAARAVR